MKKTASLIGKILLLSGMSLTAMLFISSGEQSNLNGTGSLITNRNYTLDLKRKCTDINDNINQTVFELPKIYTLPLDQSPAPPPDSSRFTEDSYEDPTINVKCWKERISTHGKTVTANFADVTIAHPTQFRSAFAGGQYGTKRALASKIAALNNAVVAINADFYNYRSEGIIIRNGTLYRDKPYKTEVLFVDSNGDLSVMMDITASEEEYYKKNKIYQSFSFGPAIVENGESIVRWRSNYSCIPDSDEPRTAIGQLGHLHYLLCTVDGRMGHSSGVTMYELSKIMVDKKCSVAYNLDGGQSSVLYFHDKPFNIVADGGERTLSDIIYFASAIPESER